MGRPLPTSVRLFRWAALGVVALLGCESLRSTSAPPAERSPVATAAPKKPGGNQPPFRVAKFVFWSDVPLEPNDVVFRELEDLPDQLQRELQLPDSNNLVQVYLFDDQEKYEAFMRDRFPWLPVRRAYFIADQRRGGVGYDLNVYTWLGPHLRVDLRHELTHALLHGVLKTVPLWLDEGLAGFFEQPPTNEGVNPDHLHTVRKGPFQPNLGRLEKIADVKQMEKAEYREAWAWVHFMLRGDPAARTALLTYLQTLRDNPNPGVLLPHLKEAFGDPNAALATHLSGADLSMPGGRRR